MMIVNQLSDKKQRSESKFRILYKVWSFVLVTRVSLSSHQSSSKIHLKMKYHTIAALVAAVVVPVFAQVPLYGQCKLLYSQVLYG